MASLLAERLTAQLLAGTPARTVVDVVRHLLAVQAQDPRGMRLAIRPRSRGLRSSDVDRALSDERSVVVTTLNRGTLHLVTVEDYWWLHPLTASRIAAGIARRLRQELVSPDDAERGVAIIDKALASNGPMTRGQLRERIAAAGIRVEGQALVHILGLASIRGAMVRGPVVGAQHAFALVRDWLGKPPRAVDRDKALAELAIRYLRGHGPADAADLAKWAGIALGDARRGLAGAGRLAERGDSLADVADRRDAPALPPPRLLGSYDPSLHGWVSRELIVGPHSNIVTSNGLFRPFAMVDGKAVATWRLANGHVTLKPLESIGAATREALDGEARAVVDYLAA